MKRLAVLLGLLLLIGATDAWGLSGHLGEFGVGDSVDVPYYAYNCSGSKRAVTCDSVSWWINKDTLGHYAMPVDSGKVTATTAPSFAVSAGRGFLNYFLRICANAGNHAPGRYTAHIEAWDDTCSQMHIVWWDCYTDSTTHEYAKNNRIIAGAVKAKTDNLPDDPADDSDMDGQLADIQAEVENLDGASMLLATATAHAAYETLFVHKEDFHSSGDTNSNPFQAGTDNVFLSGNYAQVANDNYDSMFFHKTDFHSEGDTNTNPFQAGTDDVFLSINYQTNADSFWLADTSQYSADDDSTMAGALWRLKNLYDNQNWNVWDDGTRTLTTADWSTHSAEDVWTAGSRELSTPNNYKADVSGLSTQIGTNTDPPSMSSSLFAGQQYIADNIGGGVSGCGAGAFACTLEVRDSSLQAGIHNVKIDVRNHAQTATMVYGWTNPDGKIFFALDSLQTDNSYKLWISSLDYNFTYPEPLDLRNDTTAVYYGTEFDYGAPPADSSCAVIGQVFNTLVDSLSGVVVTFTLVAPDDSLIVYNGAIFSKYEVADTTDATGRFRLDMLPEAVFDRPAGMLYYKAKIDYPVDWGGVVSEFDSVSVPIATSVDADDILH